MLPPPHRIVGGSRDDLHSVPGTGLLCKKPIVNVELLLLLQMFKEKEVAFPLACSPALFHPLALD